MYTLLFSHVLINRQQICMELYSFMEIIKQVKLSKKIIFYIKHYNGYYTSDILYTQIVPNFNVKISGARKGPIKKNKERRSFEIYSVLPHFRGNCER